MASTDDDDVALEHAHEARRLPSHRAVPQTPRPRAPEAVPPGPGSRSAVSSHTRRALINGGIAAIVTFTIGSAVVAATEPGLPELPEPPTSPTGSPTPPCTPTWEIVPSADSGELPISLNGVVALSASEAWAVGATGDPVAPSAVVVERWDGVAWTAVEAPSPGTERNELLDVDAAGPNEVWAVGRTSSGFGDAPLVLRYDGTEWLEVEMPIEIDGVLNGVAAISPTNVWVVGSVGDPAASLERGLVLHWDGQLWAEVEVGRALGGGKSLLRDIDVLTPRDLWVAGYHHNRPAIIRYGGEAWADSPTETQGTLEAVEAVASNDVWAVGSQIQHFDGTGWTPAANVRSDGLLLSVSVVGPQDVWAVGSRPTAEGTTKTLVVRFDGQRWQQIPGAGVPGSDVLSAVDALPDGTVLAVGHRDVRTGRRTLAVRGATCLATS